MGICIAILENILAVFYKVKYIFIIQPKNLILGIHPSEMKTYVYTKPCMWMWLQTLLITTQKLETTQIPFKRRMDKQLWNEIMLINKKEKLLKILNYVNKVQISSSKVKILATWETEAGFFYIE